MKEEIKWEDVKRGDVLDVTGVKEKKDLLVLDNWINKGKEIMLVTHLFDDKGSFVFVHDGSYNDPTKIQRHKELSEELTKLRDEKLTAYYKHKIQYSSVEKLKKILKGLRLRGFSRLRKDKLVNLVFKNSDYSFLLKGVI